MSYSTTKSLSASIQIVLRRNLRQALTVASASQAQRLQAELLHPRNNNRSYHVSGAGVASANKQLLKKKQNSCTRYFSSGNNNKRDFYKVLDVPKNADKSTIKKAYFKLAKQYHPDTNKGNEQAADQFKEVTEAYEVLSDENKRAMYDQFGHAGVDPNNNFGGGGNPFGGAGGPFGGAGGFNFQDGSFHFSGNSNDIDPEELFEALFGGGGRRRQRGPRRGADLQMRLVLNFQEAVFGAQKDLNVRYQARDPSSGQGRMESRTVTVDTPAGIDTGMNIRLQGQGAEGDPGAPRGNLMVEILVEPDDYFHRDGADVHVEIPVSFTQAILGGTVDVKTLTGTVEMKVPKATQVDTKLVLKGKGIQRLHGTSKGNQIVHLKIEIPTSITARQEELLLEFEEEGNKGITDRLADAARSFFGGPKKKNDDDDDDNKKQAV
mmetsp:Transcript_11292/g.17278  ORF Transcript_11292/g.17278 Transcript_11292/m.17278 type:complete len:435 (-) Transcript_11292:652-1956(-)